MKTWLPLATLLLLTASVAFAASPWLEATAPPKHDTAGPGNPAVDGREGGETIADAVPIGELPFTDTGATCDNVDDYDAVCPFTGSTAPDVVYSLALVEDVDLTVDLCGSAYDTKVYVLDADLNVLACNDDFYYDDECGVYTSLLDGVFIAGNQTVYIVVDGYGVDCGEYTMVVDTVPYLSCVLECPSGAMLEGEPPIEDDYEDVYNSGCGSPTPEDSFQELWGTGGNSLDFCAKSGWYLYEGSDYRDTDWFIAVFDPEGDGTMTVTVDAEEPLYFFELYPQNCSDVAVAQLVEAGPCAPATMTVTGEPGGIAWLWAGPTTFESPFGFEGHEFDYIVTIEGIADLVVGTENRSWSSVRSLYR